MDLTFKELANNVDIFQSGAYIGYIKYNALYGSIVTYDGEPVLDIDEQKAILEKMIEFQKEVMSMDV